MSRAPTTTAVLGVLAVWCAGFLVPELHIALLYLTPALLIGLALLASRYPGEETLIRIAARALSTPRIRCAPARARWPRVEAAMRGGLLIPAGLAGRAPPCGGRS